MSDKRERLRSRPIRIAVAAAAATAVATGAFGAAAAVSAPAAEAASPGVITSTFDYTGAVQTATVPSGFFYAKVVLTGGGGGSNGPNAGGLGGGVIGYLGVTPGETLSVVVGGAGTGMTRNTSGTEIHECTAAPGGWSELDAQAFRGGAGKKVGSYCSASGGGASLVRANDANSTIVAVAGGGGGASANYAGGVAGLDDNQASRSQGDGGPHGGYLGGSVYASGSAGQTSGSAIPGAGGGGGIRGGTGGPAYNVNGDATAGGGGAGTSYVTLDQGYVREKTSDAGEPGEAGQVTITWLFDVAARHSVSATTSFESAPTWQKANLTDGQLTSIDTDKGYTSDISTGTESVTVDLGVSQPIGSVRLFPRTAVPGEAAAVTGAGFPSSFNLLVSDDGVTWRNGGLYPAWSGQSADDGNPVTYQAADGSAGTNPIAATGRYVRLSVFKLGRAATPETGQRLQLAELQVFPPAG
jgi:Glycine rich protein/F5/8 type C domain